MEVVILCGGRGTRLREHTDEIPKPMVRIGGRPILWHVMQLYAAAGHDEFILCLGYKGDVIREYFAGSDDVKSTTEESEDSSLLARTEDGWTVRLVDTGMQTATGGRLGRVAAHVHGETFMATYSDCVADLDVGTLVAFHAEQNRHATVTVVRPPPRFGVVRLEGDRVVSFAEKQPDDEPLINGGFFVFDRHIFDLLGRDDVVLEREPLAQLAIAGQLSAFVHKGFWQCMDTPSEVAQLEGMWADGRRPWIRRGALSEPSVAIGTERP